MTDNMSLSFLKKAYFEDVMFHENTMSLFLLYRRLKDDAEIHR
jgi:hypothetical protein